MNFPQKSVGTALMVCALSGCSAPPLIPTPNLVRETAITKETTPKVGEEHTVATGDNLYSETNVTATESFLVEVQGDAYAKMDLGNRLAIKVGKEGLLRKTIRGQRAVCWDFVTTSAVTGPSHACLVDTHNSDKFDSAMFAVRDKLFPLAQSVPYKLTKRPLEVTTTNSSFKREILYQGVSKGTVKLSFREYMNDMARPAFTQDILYDLDSDGSTVVVFKGLRLKILQATGSSVKYVLLQPFT